MYNASSHSNFKQAGTRGTLGPAVSYRAEARGHHEVSLTLQ